MTDDWIFLDFKKRLFSSYIYIHWFVVYGMNFGLSFDMASF
jgi:hypothetical protein